MTKVTVRLSPECDAALREAEGSGIKNSEFIRSAILNYHSSGKWRTPAESEQAEDSTLIKEIQMSDLASDKMPDEPKGDTAKSKSLKIEETKVGQQMYPPGLHQHLAYPQSRSNRWTYLVSALVMLTVIVIICLAIRFYREGD